MVFRTTTDTLLLGGASGQICVFNLTSADGEHKVDKHIMTMCETTICYGTEALELKPGSVVMSPGFQPVCVVQMHPPAACKHLSYHSSGKMWVNAFCFWSLDLTSVKYCQFHGQHVIPNGGRSWRTCKYTSWILKWNDFCVTLYCKLYCRTCLVPCWQHSGGWAIVSYKSD